MPPGGRNTSFTCPEFTCLDGTCVPFTMVNQWFSHPYWTSLDSCGEFKFFLCYIMEVNVPVVQVCNGIGDCPDSLLAPLKGPTDEEGCRSWSSWGPWSPCSATCGTGSMSRRRTCPAGNPLYLCRGQALQRQQCFNTTCPGGGASHQRKQQIANATLELTSVFLCPRFQWTVNGCRGRPGPTVPAAAGEFGSDIEVVSLLAMEARIAPSCRDHPTFPWKSVRVS